MMGIGIATVNEVIKKFENGKIAEIEKTFNPLIYNIWNTAKGYLEKHPRELKRLVPTGSNLSIAGAGSIAKFLGGNWNESRISYLMVFSSRNLSMSDLRKRTLRFNFMYGKALSFMSLSKVAGDIFKYSWTSFFVMNVSFFIDSSLWIFSGKVNKLKKT